MHLAGRRSGVIGALATCAGVACGSSDDSALLGGGAESAAGGAGGSAVTHVTAGAGGGAQPGGAGGSVSVSGGGAPTAGAGGVPPSAGAGGATAGAAGAIAGAGGFVATGGTGGTPGGAGGALPPSPGTIVLPPNPPYCPQVLPPTQNEPCDFQAYAAGGALPCRYPGASCICFNTWACGPEAQCEQPADCPAEQPLCDTAAKLCVQCFDDTFCGGFTPFCGPLRNCVQCLNDTHCPGEGAVCQPIINFCGQGG